MGKNKKIAMLLTIFVLGAALLGGSVLGQEGEVGQVDSAVVSTLSTASGVLKAVDAVSGTVTISTLAGEEIILTLNAESKIQVGEAAADLTQLATKVDSNVTVEYQGDAKTVTVIIVQ